MSGHNKWSKIKHQKGAADQRRGKEFSRLSKDIYIVVKEGRSDRVEDNPRLRLAIEKARAANMPKGIISRAIDRGMGKGASGALAEVVYEGYAIGGVAIEIQAATDNQNRIGAEIKNIFERYGGRLGEPGSVAYIFKMEKPFLISLEDRDKEKVQELIDELESHDDVNQVKHNAQI